MRDNTDLVFVLLGVGLIYWGFKIALEAGNNLDAKFIELAKKQKMINPFLFVLYLSPIALAYISVNQYPQYAAIILLCVFFYFFVSLGAIYLYLIRKLSNQGYPNWYINKVRISQLIIVIGILLVIGIKLVRMVQIYG